MADVQISVLNSTTANLVNTFNMSDTDLSAVVDWARVSFLSSIPNSSVATNNRCLTGWFKNWMTGTINATQQFHTVPAVVPPPITITST